MIANPIKAAGVTALLLCLSVVILSLSCRRADSPMHSGAEPSHAKAMQPKPQKSQSNTSSAELDSVEEKSDRKRVLKVVGWIPHWRKSEGTLSAIQHISLFHSLSPFAFRIDSRGAVQDTLRSKHQIWARLMNKAKEHGVYILPTFVWSKSKQLEQQLIHPKRRHLHIENIVKTVISNGYDGADIDYEAKDIRIKKLFSVFIHQLSFQLHRKAKKLSCTVEPRQSDIPPEGVTGLMKMAWANDYSALNESCDQVRIMAYDQWRKGLGDRFSGTTEEPEVSHAGLSWVKDVVRYTVQHIDPIKLYLGIPTYGWQFEVEGQKGAYSYRRKKAISYPDFLELQRAYPKSSKRNRDGELSILYRKNNNRYLAVISDALSIGARVQVANEHGLSGVVFFKLDGQQDPAMWSVFKH